MGRVKCAVVVGLGLLAGCDDTLFGVPVGDGPVDVVPEYDDNWDGVQAMFDDHCADCHPSLNPWVLADVEADLADESGVYVVPGDHEASQLWRMISNTRIDGDAPVMPLGSAGLLPAEREHVKRWIDDGARLPGGDR